MKSRKNNSNESQFLDHLTVIQKIRLWLGELFHVKQSERELEEELKFDLARRVEANIAGGMTREEAEMAAKREFGSVELAKEECRDERKTRWLEDLWQDVRYGLRQMRRSPGFTAVAVLTLALGIGANSAIFGLIDAVLLRPLPVPHASELHILKWSSREKASWDRNHSFGVCGDDDPSGLSGCGFSYHTFVELRAQATSVSGVAAISSSARVHVTLGSGTEHWPATADYTSSDFFDVLQVPPFLGRAFVPEDDRLGANPVAVISYSFWREHLESDQRVVGRSIFVEDTAFTIVGVAPEGFPGINQIFPSDLWIPVHTIAQFKRKSIWTEPDASYPTLAIIARLKPHGARQRAEAELTSIYRAVMANDPRHPFATNAPPGIELANFSHGEYSYIHKRFTRPLLVLMIIVSCVLLIACANIASLNLARGSSRRAEIAIRFALGAGRVRLLRQLFAESLLMALMGAVAGSLLAIWLTRFLAAFVGHGLSLQSMLDVKPSVLVFAYTSGLAAISAIFFGLLPAIASSRVNPAVVMKAGGGLGGTPMNSVGRGNRKRPLTRALVTVQVCVTLMLLVGAGLFLRTLRNLESANTGFDKEHILVFSASLLSNYDSQGPQMATLNDELRARLSALPGVLSVSWANATFLDGGYGLNKITFEQNGHLEDLGVRWLMAGPDLFKTLGIPILEGRDVAVTDLHKKSGVVWINHALAQHIFPAENPVGKRVRLGDWCTVAGVVGDTKYESIRDDMPQTVFEPWPNTLPAYNIMIRTVGDPGALAAAAREVVHQKAPGATIFNVRTESEILDRQLFYERLLMRLSVIFGFLALLLTCVGVYGVLAYATVRRTGEIAIRMSLGAMPWDILRMILRDGLRPAIAGAVLGLLGCVGLTRLLSVFLYGIRPFDPLTFCAATALLLCVAAFASYIPARRATHVDPMIALRNE